LQNVATVTEKIATTDRDAQEMTECDAKRHLYRSRQANENLPAK
jgi:hypothetical protein